MQLIPSYSLEKYKSLKVSMVYIYSVHNYYEKNKVSLHMKFTMQTWIQQTARFSKLYECSCHS